MTKENEPTYTYQFTTRQLQCILVGLRMLQEDITDFGVEALNNQWPHFAEDDCLSYEELDDLCMDINH